MSNPFLRAIDEPRECKRAREKRDGTAEAEGEPGSADRSQPAGEQTARGGGAVERVVVEPDHPAP